MQEQLVIDDLWCVAFLLLNKKANLTGIQPAPVRPNRFQFVLRGENLTKLAGTYYDDEGKFHSFKNLALQLRHKLYEEQAMQGLQRTKEMSNDGKKF